MHMHMGISIVKLYGMGHVSKLKDIIIRIVVSDFAFGIMMV